MGGTRFLHITRFQRPRAALFASGGREILCDMIRDFVKKQAQYGASVLLDVWPNMPHDFQLLDSTQRSAIDALVRIRLVVRQAVDRDAGFQAGAMTEIAHGRFGQNTDQ